MLRSVYRITYRKLYHSLRRTVYSSVFLLKLKRFCCPLRSLFYFILLFFCPPFSLPFSLFLCVSFSLSHLQSSSRVVRLTLKIYGHQFGRLSRELTALHSASCAASSSSSCSPSSSLFHLSFSHCCCCCFPSLYIGFLTEVCPNDNGSSYCQAIT